MNPTTVAELIARLEDFDPDARVSLAIQPSWPFEHRVGDVVEVDDTVFISEAGQVSYLPGDAAEALGWR